MSAPTESDPATPHGGYAQLIGYTIEAWEPGRAVVGLEVDARHLNRSGVAHGGILSTLVDTACGYSGCYCEVPGRVRRAMTLTLTIQFMAAIPAGTRLTAEGRVTGGGRSVFFTACEVRDGTGTLVGRGDGVFKYRRGSESPEGVPLETEDGDESS